MDNQIDIQLFRIQWRVIAEEFIVFNTGDCFANAVLPGNLRGDEIDFIVCRYGDQHISIFYAGRFENFITRSTTMNSADIKIFLDTLVNGRVTFDYCDIVIFAGKLFGEIEPDFACPDDDDIQLFFLEKFKMAPRLEVFSLIIDFTKCIGHN